MLGWTRTERYILKRLVRGAVGANRKPGVRARDFNAHIVEANGGADLLVVAPRRQRARGYLPSRCRIRSVMAWSSSTRRAGL